MRHSRWAATREAGATRPQARQVTGHPPGPLPIGLGVRIDDITSAARYLRADRPGPAPPRPHELGWPRHSHTAARRKHRSSQPLSYEPWKPVVP